MREAEYALDRQTRHPNREPDIVPVEQGVLPPPRLADLHFNYRIAHLISRGAAPADPARS